MDDDDIVGEEERDDERQLIRKFKAITVNNEKVDTLAQKTSRNISTAGSWSNREEEWYFVNKRLLFATQSAQAGETWIQNMNELLG